MSLRLQPSTLSNGTMPYPYFIDADGMVGRQDFWKGNPYKLIGFANEPIAGVIDLTHKQFLKSPQKAVGLYPVFSKQPDDEWYTLKNTIDSVGGEL